MIPQRIRGPRSVIWTGIVFCGVIAVAWIVSTNWAVGFRGRLGFGLQHGCVAVILDSTPSTIGWVMWNTDRVALAEQRLADVSWWFVHRQGPGWRWLAIPLWIPFLLIALTTGIYRYRARITSG